MFRFKTLCVSFCTLTCLTFLDCGSCLQSATASPVSRSSTEIRIKSRHRVAASSSPLLIIQPNPAGDSSSGGTLMLSENPGSKETRLSVKSRNRGSRHHERIRMRTTERGPTSGISLKVSQPAPSAVILPSPALSITETQPLGSFWLVSPSQSLSDYTATSITVAPTGRKSTVRQRVKVEIRSR